MMGSGDSEIFQLGLLTNDDCWLLLSHMALPEGNKGEFEDVGRKIAEKCNGLPLAAKTLGSLLRFKRRLEEWKVVLKSEIWKIEKVEVELFPHLLLSYNELSPTLKRCFSYCAVFSKDSIIDVESLIENWMALGYLDSNAGEMELKGRECFDVLAMGSLFQDFEKNDFGEIESCKMHDIVHDFAEFLKESGRVHNKTTCQVCDPLLVSHVNEFCSLIYQYDCPSSFCDCLKRLRVISIIDNGIRSIPRGMEKFIHLRKLNLDHIQKLESEDLKIIFQLYSLQNLALIGCCLEEISMELGNLIHLRCLNLSRNASLKELPREIGNLIHLRNLNLNGNTSLKELPREIWNLIDLRHLQLSALNELSYEIGNLTHLRHLHLDTFDTSLKELPESICGLKELQTLSLHGCIRLCRVPEGVGQLTSLRSLPYFYGGSGWSKLGILKNLNHLSGNLDLIIRLDGDGDVEEVVEEARKAELRNKIHIERLTITFRDHINEMDVIDALEPHPNLRTLLIKYYMGTKLPLGWIVSPLNNLREVYLSSFSHLTSLPPLGRLPCLEDIDIVLMGALETVGREFLGVEVGISNANVIAFPKLKKLNFVWCVRLKEWEDITAEEEYSATFQVMPCLTLLRIKSCNGLTMLPHRLLRKVTSLKTLCISGSKKLKQRYADKDGSDWKSITQNIPGLQLEHDD